MSTTQLLNYLKQLDEIDLIDLLQIDSAMIVESFRELITTNYDYLKDQIQQEEFEDEE